MQDHLIAKNVAADVAVKLCESLANNLEGKVLGMWPVAISNPLYNLRTNNAKIQERSRASTAP